MRTTQPATVAAMMVVRVWDADDGESSEFADNPDTDGLAFEDSTVVTVGPDDKVVVNTDSEEDNRKDWADAVLEDVTGVDDLSAVLDIEGSLEIDVDDNWAGGFDVGETGGAETGGGEVTVVGEVGGGSISFLNNQMISTCVSSTPTA